MKEYAIAPNIQRRYYDDFPIAALQIEANKDFQVPVSGEYLAIASGFYLGNSYLYYYYGEYKINESAIAKFQLIPSVPIGGVQKNSLYVFPGRAAIITLTKGIKYKFTVLTAYQQGGNLSINLINPTMPEKELNLEPGVKLRYYDEPREAYMADHEIVGHKTDPVVKTIRFAKSGRYLLFLSGTSTNITNRNGLWIAVNLQSQEIARSQIPVSNSQNWKYTMPMVSAIVPFEILADVDYEMEISHSNQFDESDRAWVSFLWQGS